MPLDCEDEGSHKQNVSLKNDFDTVVRYGETTVELNANGSVIVNTKGRTITCENSSVTIRVPANDTKTGEKITALAADIARKYGHATITFNHLLAAVLQTAPQQIDGAFGSKIRAATLMSLLEKDLKNTESNPQTLLPGSNFAFSETASAALSQTKDAIKRWNSDRFFGLELIHSMLKAGRVPHSESSVTLQYVDMVVSSCKTLDAAKEVRAMIDKFGAASGETAVRVIRYDMGQP